MSIFASDLDFFAPKLKWYCYPAKLNQACRALYDAGILVSANDIMYFHEKPWKWETEVAELNLFEAD